MKIWKESIENPDTFWLKVAKDLCYWKKEPTKGFDWKDPDFTDQEHQEDIKQRVDRLKE